MLKSRHSIGDSTKRQAGEDDLDDAVEELLFGWFEGWNREGRKAKNKSLNSIFSFPFFLFEPIIFKS